MKKIIIGIDWTREIEDDIYSVLRDTGLKSVRAYDAREAILTILKRNSIGQIVTELSAEDVVEPKTGTFPANN